MDQIQKEAERKLTKVLDRDIAGIGNQPPMRDGGGGDWRKNRGGSGVNEDGWHNFGINRINRNVYRTKLRVKLESSQSIPPSNMTDFVGRIVC